MGACCIQYVLLLSLLGFSPCSGEDVEEQLAHHHLNVRMLYISFSVSEHHDWRRKTIADMGEGNHVQKPEKDLVSAAPSSPTHSGRPAPCPCFQTGNQRLHVPCSIIHNGCPPYCPLCSSSACLPLSSSVTLECASSSFSSQTLAMLSCLWDCHRGIGTKRGFVHEDIGRLSPTGAWRPF